MMLTGLPRLEEDTSHKGSRKESGGKWQKETSVKAGQEEPTCRKW